MRAACCVRAPTTTEVINELGPRLGRRDNHLCALLAPMARIIMEKKSRMKLIIDSDIYYQLHSRS